MSLLPPQPALPDVEALLRRHDGPLPSEEPIRAADQLCRDRAHEGARCVRQVPALGAEPRCRREHLPVRREIPEGADLRRKPQAAPFQRSGRLDGPAHLDGSRELVCLDPYGAGSVRALAPELDTPVHRGQWPDGARGSYYLLCVRSGALLPGRQIVPERIRESRNDYVEALIAADTAWDAGHLDFSVMEEYLAALLEAQLQDDGLPYQGASSV